MDIIKGGKWKWGMEGGGENRGGGKRGIGEMKTGREAQERSG